jgi:arginase family enzyme
MIRRLFAHGRRGQIPVAALLAATFLSTATLSAEALAKPIGFAADVAPKVEALSADKRAFISESDNLPQLMLTPQKVEDAFRTRTPAEVDAYVTGLMQVVADSRFQPGVDSAEIALNPGATGFNGSTTLKPALFDEYPREPGPFSLDHYMFDKGGVRTFAHAPIALRKEDLVAGKVEVAFVGVPLDFSSGWRDGKHGPMFLRGSDGLVGTDIYTGIDPALALRLADFGDISIDYMSVERTIDHVRFMIGDIASTGAVPFIVGGDHSLMYPDVAAMVDVYGKGKVGVIQLDAHYEGDQKSEHLISDTQAVRRLIGDGIIAGGDIVQVGLRGGEASTADLDRMRSQGVRFHSMADIEKDGWQSVVKKALDEVRAGPDHLFISFDLSVLDPVYATAVGRPVPNGLTMREAVPLVRMLCSQSKVVGFEVLDPAPILDTTYKTAQNANYIMHSCLAGIAQRKAGN